ncbi:MAG: energy transducer TonB [Candidatus Acidiferrales bacterium]
MLRSCFPTLLASLALFLASPLPAQNLQALEKHLKANYERKAFVLRNLWNGPEIKYNSAGHTPQIGAVCSWTVCARIEVKKLKLRRDRLELEGIHLFTYYKDKEKRFAHTRSRQAINITVQLNEDQLNENSLNELLANVFSRTGEMSPHQLPSYWQAFLQGCNKEGLCSDPRVESATQPPGSVLGFLEQPQRRSIYSVGGGVSKPKCVTCPAPHYSEAARQAGFQGTVDLWAVVNENGRVEEIQVAKPLGMGLDEEAVNTIQQWQFEPARRNGEPVAVRLILTMGFHLY